jgi:hypothetical protein
MPRGPKGEKRPADVIGNAVHVMRIATGEIEESFSQTFGPDGAMSASYRTILLSLPPNTVRHRFKQLANCFRHSR